MLNISTHYNCLWVWVTPIFLHKVMINQHSNVEGSYNLNLTTDDVKDKLCDKIMDDIEVETEPNVFEKYEEYVSRRKTIGGYIC